MGLSLTETKKTLDFVRPIKEVGKSAIFIDHNIFNIYPVVDRLYVLDRGKVAGVYQPRRHHDGSADRAALPRRAHRKIDGVAAMTGEALAGPAGRQPRRAAVPAAALRQPARHHRRRPGDVARLRHRRAAGVHRHRHLSRLRRDDAAVRHRRAVADLRRHHRRNRSVVPLGDGARHGGVLPRHRSRRRAVVGRPDLRPRDRRRLRARQRLPGGRASTFRRSSSPSARSSCSAASSSC